MSAKILAGKEFAERFKLEAKCDAQAIKDKYGVEPGLAVIVVGDDPASAVYVRNKHRTCAELNIYSEVIAMPATATKDEIVAKIRELNAAEKIHGILVQLPLPKAVSGYEAEILESIDPRKDVDGFHPLNVGKLVSGEAALVPCTPLGCIKMLDAAGICIDGARAVVVGRSNIVGKPMLHLLMQRHATVTVCHSHTKDLAAVTRQADILVVAIGRPQMITADMVKVGATVIDVGINRIAEKKLVGDVDFDGVAKIAGAITPVPGGVGLLTVAMLMKNVVTAAKMQLSQ